MKKFLFEKITKPAGAFKESRIILTANELDVFTHIEKGARTFPDMAKKIKADKDSLETLLNALCALNFLKKKGGKYYNTALGSQMLVKGKKDYLGDTLLHYSNMWKTWSELTETVKRGQKIKNKHMIKEKKKSKNRSAFIMAMHNNAKYKAEELAEKLKLKGVKKLLDLGGGPGTYGIYFAKANKNLNCTVYDLPNITGITKKIIKQLKADNKVSVVSGDFLTDPVPGGFDAAFLSSIIHIYGEKENIKVFKKVYSSLKDKGKIIIKDYILDNSKTKPVYPAIFAINMLAATKTGGVYTQNEITAWLKAAGFKNIKRRDILDFSIITGER
ncbi:MAG: methyltransferase [Armatimonadota bacterium]